MKDEAVSSSRDPLLPPRSSSPPPSLTPAASSAGASSPAVPTNAGSSDGLGQVQNSKGGSVSRIGSHPMHTSLSTSAGGSALGSSQPSCRPWERGDLLRRLSTFEQANWFGKPKVSRLPILDFGTSDEQVEILRELIYQYDYWLILGNIDRRMCQVVMQPECDQKFQNDIARC